MGRQGPQPQKIGVHQLVRRLGAGPQSELWEVHSSGEYGLRRRWSLRIHPLLDRRDPAWIRYAREAAQCSHLEHPHVTATYACGIDEQTTPPRGWVLGEFIDGVSLRQVIQHLRTNQLRLPLVAILDLVLPACEALHYAAEEVSDANGTPLRLLHRGLAPNKLMLTRHGVIKVLDVGVTSAPTVGALRSTRSLDDLGAMSPEQANALSMDGRSDVYSLCAITYELATLSPLFEGPTPTQVVRLAAQGDVSGALGRLRTVHPQLATVLARGLAAHPDERYRSALELRNALKILRVSQRGDSGLLELARSVWEGLPERTHDQHAAPEEETTPVRGGGGGQPTPGEGSDLLMPFDEESAEEKVETADSYTESDERAEKSAELVFDRLDEEITDPGRRPSPLARPITPSTPPPPSPTESPLLAALEAQLRPSGGEPPPTVRMSRAEVARLLSQMKKG